MKFGFVFPFGDARTVANLTAEAEETGWDGIFVWDPVWGIDPAVILAAAAMQTSRIRLGTMLTPLSRHRPWKVAGEMAALDNLSGGRVTLSVGLGAVDTGFESFGEVTDRKTRAELLDEGLEIIDGLWHGQPFNFRGKHYQVKETTFHVPPAPVQTPRIPIWVVGSWPRMRSMHRVLRWDGLIPAKQAPDGSHVSITPEDIQEMSRWIQQNRTASSHFDIVQEGSTSGLDQHQAAATVQPWADAGVTWWLEADWSAGDVETVQKRIRQGPPRLD